MKNSNVDCIKNNVNRLHFIAYLNFRNLLLSAMITLDFVNNNKQLWSLKCFFNNSYLVRIFKKYKKKLTNILQIKIFLLVNLKKTII